MKLFGRTGGYYLFWSGAVYLTVGLTCAFYFKEFPKEIIQIAWISVLALPFTYPPLGRYFNLDIEWDRKMFDFFRRRTAKDYMDEASNVYNLPKPKLVEPTQPIPPKPEPTKEAKIFYRIGATDQNRVAFSMGHMEITMNREGCQQMIDQITVFMNQIQDEVDNVEETSNR